MWVFWFWQFAAIFYFTQIWFTLALEREARPSNLMVGLLMYFFYGYLWMGAIARALYHDVVVRKERNWDKTVRFATELEVGNGLAEPH